MSKINETCKCDKFTKLVGYGCSACNPEYEKETLQDALELISWCRSSYVDEEWRRLLAQQAHENCGLLGRHGGSARRTGGQMSEIDATVAELMAIFNSALALEREYADWLISDDYYDRYSRIDAHETAIRTALLDEVDRAFTDGFAAGCADSSGKTFAEALKKTRAALVGK